MHRPRRTLATICSLALAGTALGMYAPTKAAPPLTWSSVVPASPAAGSSDAAVRLAASVFGHSGKLRAVLTTPTGR
jgi:hypothetical protein